MTIVVADTSPLNYLVLIGEIDILPALYGKIVIPEEVFTELTHPDAPLAVREWIRQAPAWLDVRRNPIDANALLVENLDAGECAAIQLAQGEERALLLMDDAAGRRVADRLGIAQIGTLGILRLAATADLIELPDALNKLVKTNFRVAISLVSTLIAQDAHRRH